ncbi:MAG: hypothetical protein AAGG56_07825 [Pseudomonadota bacterium]
MDIAVEDRFFTALNAVVAARLGAHHTCTLATANAARIPTTINVNSAHQELARLDPIVRKDIESELATWMRADI